MCDLLRLITDNDQTFQYSFENVELEEIDEDDEENDMINNEEEIVDVVGTSLNRHKYRNVYTCDNKMQILKNNNIMGPHSRLGTGNPIENNITWSVAPFNIVPSGASGFSTLCASGDTSKYLGYPGGNFCNDWKLNTTTADRQTIPLTASVDGIKLENWSGNIKYVNTNRGNKLLYFEGHRYIKNNIYGSNIYWKCTKWHNQCKGRAITSIDSPEKCIMKGVHNHPLLSSDDLKNSFY